MPVNRLSRLSATPGEPATPSRQNDDRTSYVRCRSTDSADSSDSAPPRANLRQLVARTTTESRRLEGVLCSAQSCSGRRVGKRTTSRIEAEAVSSITDRQHDGEGKSVEVRYAIGGRRL